jgi:hypothetical protein
MPVLTSFLYRVAAKSSMLCLGHQLQVIHIATKSVATFVMDLKASWYRTLKQRPDYPMHGPIVVFPPNKPIRQRERCLAIFSVRFHDRSSPITTAWMTVIDPFTNAYRQSFEHAFYANNSAC